MRIPILSAIIDYFVVAFDEFPREIKRKVRILATINIFTILYNIIIIFSRFYTSQPLEFLYGDIIFLIPLIISLLLLRKNHPIAAGLFTISSVTSTLVHTVFADYILNKAPDIARVNDTIINLMIYIFISVSFILNKRQYYLLILLSNAIIATHIIIFFFTTEEMLSYWIFFEIVKVSAILILCETIGYYIQSLTIYQRGKLFSNIIFYKLAPKGPVFFYSEHPLDERSALMKGVHFYTAIGGGQDYHVGMFGPLPFSNPEGNEVAFVYSTFVPDSKVHDPRLLNRNFLLIVLVTTPANAHLIDARSFSELLRRLINKIEDLSLLTKSQLNEIVQHLKDY